MDNSFKLPDLGSGTVYAKPQVNFDLINGKPRYKGYRGEAWLTWPLK